MRSNVVLAALAAVLVTTGSASAQNDTPEVLPPAGGDKPASEAPKTPAKPMAGYAFSDKAPAASAPAKHSRYRKNGPVVNMPGFEQTGDGGSRLFVQLSQTVPVEERKANGSITYVLKGASPRVHNNTNALVTVHFNTPVAKARLVPKGKDLLFVIDLRSAATPTWKINEGPDKSQVLSIDFPKGDFLPSGASSDPSTESVNGAGSGEESEAAPAEQAKPKPASKPAAAKKPPPAPAKP